MLRLKPDISAVIFDMDGLIFDTERLAIEAWQHAGQVYQCEIPESLLLQCVGLDTHNTRLVLEQSLGTSFNFDRIRACRIQYFADVIEQRGVPIKDGLYELLDVLEQHAMSMAVATSTERTQATSLLNKAQVLTRFNAVVCGDEVSHGKPAPDIFLLAAHKLQLNPQRCLVLEDSEHGIRAAVNANMQTFMVPDMKLPSPEMLDIADQMFPNLYDVASYLSRSRGHKKCC